MKPALSLLRMTTEQIRARMTLLLLERPAASAPWIQHNAFDRRYAKLEHQLAARERYEARHFAVPVDREKPR